jgi:ribosomal-protein-alanine N-acetyltransferase
MPEIALNIPVVTTERLRLEPLSMAHSAGMFALWSRPEVVKYSGPITDVNRDVIPMPAASAVDSDKLITFWLNAAKDGWGFRWAILLRETNAFAGIVGFNAVGEQSEIAFHLNPDQWGAGVMTEASVDALDWLRDLGVCKECDAFIEPENEKSIALAERLGFAATEDFADGAQRYSKAL